MATDKDDPKDTGTKDGEGTKEDAKDHAAEAEKWKALARKHEQRAKDSHEELEKLKAEGDTSKTELEKINERLAAAEKRAEAAEIEGRRFQVAAAKKLTPAQAKRLQGTTLEELEADADDLIEAFTPPDTGDSKDGDDTEPKTTGGGKPKERLRPGADTSAEPEGEDDPRKLADAIASRL